MVKPVLEIPPSLELGVSVGPGSAPGLDLSFGTSKSCAKGELGLQEGEGYTRGLGCELSGFSRRAAGQVPREGGGSISTFLHRLGPLLLLQPAGSECCCGHASPLLCLLLIPTVQTCLPPPEPPSRLKRTSAKNSCKGTMRKF